MASTSSTNVNELLPGLETFLRSMLNGTQLDDDHRQIAAVYLDKIDQFSKSTDQQSSMADDQSLCDADIVFDEESDDFTDEEEEEEEQSTPTVTRHSSICDNHPHDSNSQWYIDASKTEDLESLTYQSSTGHEKTLSSITPSRLSISTSSNIIADGLLLTYDKNHNWIWRYYVLDDFDLICFPANKKSRLTSETQSDNDCLPLWVSDMTNAKVHKTVRDKIECLCLQIGLAEAIYVRPSDSNQLNIWLKAFRDAASSQKSKNKNRNNVKTLSRNARRMFAQFNRKKGQIVSHLLDQMANVTGVDDKTRKHCELRGFLVISLDNQTFVTKYCTIVDGIFRIHKSRLSEQTDHQLDLNHCTLSFPEERTRDIQFALNNEQTETIFIRGNNIYSMGRLLNTLAKYVKITGSSKEMFTSTPLNKHRINSDLESSSIIPISQSKEDYSPSDVKTSLYRNASKVSDDHEDSRTFVLPTARRSLKNDRNVTPIPHETIISNETYDRPKSYDNLTSISVDRNNNNILIPPPQPRERTRNEDENSLSEFRSATNLSNSHRLKYKPSDPIPSPDTSSPENTSFRVHSSAQHQSSHCRRQPHPLPRRSSTDYVNKFTNLFTKNFSTPIPNERNINAQTYNTITPLYNSDRIQKPMRNDDAHQQLMSNRIYDIPITTEHSAFEEYDESDDKDEETVYDNLSKQDGIGKFRFVIPFNHSPRSAFTTIKPINSPLSSSYSTIPQTSSSSNNSTNRPTLMTAV